MEIIGLIGSFSKDDEVFPIYLHELKIKRYSYLEQVAVKMRSQNVEMGPGYYLSCLFEFIYIPCVYARAHKPVNPKSAII